MQAVYWYAVLLLQPTLYLVSVPGPSHGPGRGDLGGEEDSSLAEKQQTHGSCRRPAASPARPPGVGPGQEPGQGGAALGQDLSTGHGGGRPVTSPLGRGAPPGPGFPVPPPGLGLPVPAAGPAQAVGWKQLLALCSLLSVAASAEGAPPFMCHYGGAAQTRGAGRRAQLSVLRLKCH